MPQFTACFSKVICNDTGHESVVCQDEFNVEADTLADATAQAEVAFCDRKKIRQWDYFADRVELRLRG